MNSWHPVSLYDDDNSIDNDKEEASCPSIQLTVDTSSKDGFFSIIIDSNSDNETLDDESMVPMTNAYIHKRRTRDSVLTPCPFSSPFCNRRFLAVMIIVTTTAVLLFSSTIFFGVGYYPSADRYQNETNHATFTLEDSLPGGCISMSKDGTVLAVLENIRSRTSSSPPSRDLVPVVRMYRRTEKFNRPHDPSSALELSWEPIGQPINHDHYSTIHSVALSGNGTAVALILPSGLAASVLTYNEERDLWLAQGQSNQFNSANSAASFEIDESNGNVLAVALCSDATIVAVARNENSNILVDMYRYNGISWNSWEQSIALPSYMSSIDSIDLASDGNTMVIFGRRNESQRTIFVYKWSSSLSSPMPIKELHWSVPLIEEDFTANRLDWVLVATEESILPTEENSTVVPIDIVDVALSSNGKTLAIAMVDSIQVLTAHDDGQSWNLLGQPIPMTSQSTTTTTATGNSTPSDELLSFGSSTVNSISILSSISIAETETGYKLIAGGTNGRNSQGIHEPYRTTGIVESYSYYDILENSREKTDTTNYEWVNDERTIPYPLGIPKVHLSWSSNSSSNRSGIVAVGPFHQREKKEVTHIYTF